MKRSYKIGAAAAGVLAVAGLGGGAALAQNSKAATVPAHTFTQQAPAATPDPGPAVQSGDQTTPDVPGTAETVEAPSAPETAGESAVPSDGPGGHADPAGDVQNVGGANEQ
jgi:hypothetical protein